MKSKKAIIVIVAAFVILLGGATVLYNSLKDSVDKNQIAGTGESQNDADETQDNAGEEKEKTPAPDFTVYDVDGKEVYLSDMIGKPVIINFWATWCTYCVQEMPDFEEKFKEYGDEIHFMMINVTDGTQETVESASAHVKEHKYTFPVYYDTTYDATGQYTTGSLPITYFIDAEGNFVAYGQGALDADTLQSGIDMLIK